MRLSERLSKIIYSIPAFYYLKTFNDHSFEKVLGRSANLLTPEAKEQLINYTRSSFTKSGGFANRAGDPDLYYTLFGLFIAEMLKLTDLFPSVSYFINDRTKSDSLNDVHLYCAAILSVKLGNDGYLIEKVNEKINMQIKEHMPEQRAYDVFLILMTCYYLKNYRGLFRLRKIPPGFKKGESMPCAVNAAILVIQKSLGNPVGALVREIFSFYNGDGGFRAVRNAPVADLLSTGVALYALSFAGYDLRAIKPDCLQFIDSLSSEGGFSATVLDSDPDIEYTFYGLLALGSLA